MFAPEERPAALAEYDDFDGDFYNDFDEDYDDPDATPAGQQREEYD
jgi:hypothetical protein